MTIEYKDSKRISALSSDLEGLKAYWKMNDSSGKLLNTASSQGDTAFSGSDLTISGTTGYGVTGHVSGVNAYSFTQTNGNKAVADNSASDWNFLTNSGNKFTITLWLKVDSNSVNADFLGTGGSGTNDLGIRYRGGVSDKKFAIFFSNEGEKITSTSTTLTDTNWHFYMIQYDDSVGTLRFQKDAVAVEEFTGLNLTSTGNPTTALSFGDSQGSTSETGGDMQEVTVWDRYLTTAEIAQIYNSGSGAQLQNTTIPFGGRPTDVQDNTILVEKDTARRYWFDAESTATVTTDEVNFGSGYTYNSSYFSATGSNGYTFTENASNIDQVMWKDLTTSVVGTKYVMRFPFTLTSFTSHTTSGNNHKQEIGLGASYGTGEDPTHDGFFCRYVQQQGSNEVRFFVLARDGSTRNLSQAYSIGYSSISTPTTWYIELIKNEDVYTLNVFDDSAYSNSLGTATVTQTGITGLRYFNHNIFTQSSDGVSNGSSAGYDIYNDVTVVTTPATWTMQPTWRDDFSSSTGWGSVGSGVSVTGGKLDANFTTNADNRIYKDLGFDLEDQFIAQFDYYQGTVASGPYWNMFSFNEDSSLTYTNGKQSIGMIIDMGSYALHSRSFNGSTDNTNDTGTVSLSANTQFYLTVIRDGTSFKTKVYEDSSRSTQVGSTIESTLSSINQPLRYFHTGYYTGGNSGTAIYNIDNLKVYNGVTSIN